MTRKIGWLATAVPAGKGIPAAAGILAGKAVVAAVAVGVLALGVFALPPAAGARDLDLVAVLELDNPSKRVSVQEVQFVTDAVRKAAAEGLDRGAYLVLTRENMDLIVPPEDRKCMAGMCYAEIGRKLQARFVVGGRVTDVGRKFGVTLEVYEARTGQLLASEMARADDVDGVVDHVQRLAPSLMRRIVPASSPGRAPAAGHAPGPAVSPVPGPAVAPAPPPPAGAAAPGRVEHVSEIRAEVGMLRVEGSPKGARLDIAGPREFGDRGRLATALPYGPFEVPAGQYRVDVSSAGYDPETRTAFVPSDRTVVVDVALVQSEGVLEVTGTPAGARVDLSCAKGFSRAFGLPGTLSVPRGTCAVKVTRAGYEAFERTVEVEGGKTARVEVKLAEAAAPAAPAAGTAGGTSAGKAGIEWVTIPGGRFRMGGAAFDNEKPVHEVTVRRFQMARTEVTVAQYRACVQAVACTEPGTGGSCNWGVAGRDAHPVNCVSWDQAAAFSAWVGGRLPTEAEWEYAARGGTTGDTYGALDEVAWYASNSGGGTKPAGLKRANAHGLHDMLGNVWEWVQDCWHGSYGGAPSDGSAWESGCSGSARVFRGG
ncbi:MAG: SUMF1/EgtB/PvdO family nonheme iron enzyme, partial [Deltaproteobacteria bacterium]|nr:SUMF1/EgtB/PvdO family nonheme iron enzyme [Deltaproteobacteria bacterium]